MIVLTGPSASGKTATCLFLQDHFGIRKVVTHTTRPKREGERDGIDYHFVTEEEFRRMEEEGLFVETVLYNGYHYGTSKKEVRIDKCLAVELSGAKVYRGLKDPRIVLFFLKAEEGQRERRMKERGDAPEKILSRLENDRQAFQLDGTIESLIDGVIDTESHSLEEVSEIVYSRYLEILKERGISFMDELKRDGKQLDEPGEA